MTRKVQKPKSPAPRRGGFVLPGKQHYVFDTEFIEDGRTIDLISIAVVAEDGREFYRCSLDADLSLASPWVRQNVMPHLPRYGDKAWAPRDNIRLDLDSFIMDGGHSPCFWAYYADYDWVALCQLYGRMIDLPAHFPKYCMDLKQYSVMLGSPPHPPQPVNAHDARADARWGWELLRKLRNR